MPLKNNIFQIINYFVLSAPIFISSTAVLDSFFNQNYERNRILIWSTRNNVSRKYVSTDIWSQSSRDV